MNGELYPTYTRLRGGLRHLVGASLACGLGEAFWGPGEIFGKGDSLRRRLSRKCFRLNVFRFRGNRAFVLRYVCCFTLLSFGRLPKLSFFTSFFVRPLLVSVFAFLSFFSVFFFFRSFSRFVFLLFSLFLFFSFSCTVLCRVPLRRKGCGLFVSMTGNFP